MRHPTLLFAFVTILFFANSSGAVLAETRVVILGTGTPVPDAARSGPGVAVIYNGKAYVFDAGGGMVQRAIEASERLGIAELYPTRIEHLFITHLHSDHTLDYAELAATLWWRRENQLKAWGPEGLAAMSEAMYRMMARDIALRTSGNQPVVNPEYYRVQVTEIDEGVVFEDGDLVIEAFKVPHGDIKPAFGYRVRTPDKTVVISGDTAYSEKLLEMAMGADVLVHEVISAEGVATLPEFWQQYHAGAHTSTTKLAGLARQARPGLLVLYHILFYGATEESVIAEIRAGYDGEFVLANDLDVF
jgi:ribonuclease BN (tRNA processing enzyme)